MKGIRRAVLWSVLATIGLLAGLSVVGAFLGTQRAGVLFRSVPLVVFWVILAGLFLAGFFFYRRLVRSPGLLAMHAGPLLILLGSMYGSEQGHRLTGKLLGGKKIPSGYMAIFEGKTSNRILNRDLKTQIGSLPFSLQLKDFRIEYYEPEDKRWQVIVEVPPSKEGGDRKGKPVKEWVEWVVGKDVDVPHTEVRLRVLTYLQNARPTFAEDIRPVLEIVQADGKKLALPAKVGQKVSLKSPEVKLRIVQVFSRLVVEGSGKDRRVMDVPGEPENPALKIEMELANGTKETRYVMQRVPMHGQRRDGLTLRYASPKPTGARADPDSEMPAMEVLVTREEKELRRWLIPREGERHVRLPLASLFGESGTKDGECAHEAGVPSLHLVKPVGQIRDYKSDLTVLEEGQAVARKTIEVNDPLHYGGYHFYQYSYDSQNERYTVLSITSDSGLWAVYCGFFLLVAGMFWQFWMRPGWRHLTKRRKHGD